MKLRPDLGISSSLDTLLLISFGRLAFYFDFFFSFFLSLFLFTLILLPCDFLSSMCHWHPFGSPPLPDVCVRQQPITNSSPVSPVWFCVGPSVSLSCFLSLTTNCIEYSSLLKSDTWIYFYLLLFFSPNIRRTPKRKENKPHLCIFDFTLRFRIPASTGRLYELVTFGHTKTEATHLTIAISRLFFENSYLPSSSLSCRIRTFYFLFFFYWFTFLYDVEQCCSFRTLFSRRSRWDLAFRTQSGIFLFDVYCSCLLIEGDVIPTAAILSCVLGFFSCGIDPLNRVGTSIAVDHTESTRNLFFL